MFTGIVQGVARVSSLTRRPGLVTMTLELPASFCDGLEVGASVSVDGVCLTVTRLHTDGAEFDVMQQSLAVTTLAALKPGDGFNVERAARDGAEIGGHPLSGHVDGLGRIVRITTPENNRVLRIALPPALMRYVFAKGYIAVNGCSLTAAEVDKRQAWFEVWLIPETLRMTTFAAKREGDPVNIEIERQTQVFVDTVRDAIEERLGPLVPALEALLRQQGLSLEDATRPPPTGAARIPR
jgi:riboflavin synthase